jgi:hypothetical protein
MARVACTHPTDLRWTEASRLAVGRWSTVLSGGTNPVLFWRILEEVDICRSGTYICHVVRNPQLGFNRFESSLLLGYGDLILRPLIVVNQWKYGYLWLWICKEMR